MALDGLLAEVLGSVLCARLALGLFVIPDPQHGVRVLEPVRADLQRAVLGS